MSRDSEVREAIEALRVGTSNDERYDLGWHDAVQAALAILDRSSEAAPTRTWPSRDELAAMPDAEVNAFLASRGFDVRVVDSEAAPVVGLDREAELEEMLRELVRRANVAGNVSIGTLRAVLALGNCPDCDASIGLGFGCAHWPVG